MKVVGYVRVSTEDQKDSGLSMSHQEAKIRSYADAMDLDLITVIQDAGKSAKNMNREGLQSALNMLKRGEASGLVILKLDRLTRSVKDLGELVEVFQKQNVALISVQDSINTSTAAGRLVLNVLGSVAQWEREAISERTSAALQEKRRQGKVAGNVPYGFDLADDRETLIPNEREQEALALMRELRGRGYSYRAICEGLQEKGFSPKTGKKFYPATIRKIIRSSERYETNHQEACL